MPPKAKGKTGKARAHHARGLAALEQGDLEGAAAAFRASLAAQATGPSSAEAANSCHARRKAPLRAWP